jgi:hypothetical protein
MLATGRKRVSTALNTDKIPHSQKRRSFLQLIIADYELPNETS